MIHSRIVFSALAICAVRAECQSSRKITDSSPLLTLTTYQTVDDPSGLVWRMPSSTVRAPSGELFLLPGAFGPKSLPVRVSADGKSIRLLGRSGNGPGEFSNVHSLSLTTDGLIRVHMLGRSALVRVDGTFVREVRTGSIPNHLDIVPLSGLGALVLTGTYPNAADKRPVLELDSLGRTIRTLPVAATGAQPPDRSLGPGRLPLNTYWVTESNDQNPRGYTIRQFDLQGKLLRTLIHEPSWWIYSARDESVYGKAGPSSYSYSVRERSDGLLLITFVHPKQDWRRVSISPDEGGRNNWYESKLVVLSPSSGTVVGVASLRGVFATLLSDDIVSVYEESEMGEPLVKLFRIAVPRR